MKNPPKKVICTGVSGQAGSLMVEYLLKNTDYEIHGMVRRLSVQNHKNINHLKGNPRFHLFSGDLTDGHSLQQSIEEIKPDYYINAAAQSFVAESWVSPVNTFITDSVAVIYILEAIRKHVPHCRFINFASSEMFGDIQYTPQDINHPFRSRSPYAAAKVAAHQIVKVYRESYNIYCLSAICFNYEGRNRGIEFISRKITNGVARIYHAIKNNQTFEPIKIGNTNARRDWSDAEDVVDGIWKMLNQPTWETGEHGIRGLILQPKEYVLASGETHTVKKFIELAFSYSGIHELLIQKYGEGSFHWYGDTMKYGKTENDPKATYWWSETGDMGEKFTHLLIDIDPKFYRPNEVQELCGNSTPIRQELGWQPKTTFPELVKKMVAHDIAIYQD